MFHGLVFPTNSVIERNGVLWHSSQVLNLEINPVVDNAQFQMDEKIATQSAQGKGWESSFAARKPTELASGVSLYEGSWNTTLIKQEDGLFVLEAPISTVYVQGLLDYAGKTYPNTPVKAVFSTSDSWPHVGGVRQVVAHGLPVYILDLNRPLLDRFMNAPHSLHPDLLAQSKKQPDWRIVSGRVTLGSGSNRVEIYPIRGASTERQYMVYFPEHHLLYASDTLAFDDKGNLYDAELMREVAAAVKREGLQVTTVYAMHQGPTPWSKVETLLRSAGVAG